MASSEDFKEALRAGKLTEAFVMAMSKATELNIITWVASSEEQLLPSAKVASAKPGYRMRTRLNLVEGSIDNEIGDQFIGSGPYQELRQFHLEQVVRGTQAIKNNLDSLNKLFRLLAVLQQQKLAPNQPLELVEIESQLLSPDEDEAENFRLEIEPQKSSIEAMPIVKDTEVGTSEVSPTTEASPVVEEILEEPQLETPEPEMPVSDLEVEDWEDSALRISSVAALGVGAGLMAKETEEDDDILSLEDLEPEPLEEEEEQEFDLASQTPPSTEVSDIEKQEESRDLSEPESVKTQRDLDLSSGLIAVGAVGAVGAVAAATAASAADREDLVPEETEELELPSLEAEEDLGEEFPISLEETPRAEEEEDWGDLIPEEAPVFESGMENLEELDLEEEGREEELGIPELSLGEASRAEEEEDWGDL
ncbi:MAG: hypothetical protein F6K10_02635, partial [Moorea sp. SIO2B7]|nr:hypothetical protein [Moorena sp. SIO2B7]